ncbi:MAG: hypothetical protein M3Z21_04035, partial [Pseudomonadota bacterium]|nr:hypothetical protein [Pseudomonadota bacterium]
IKAIMCVETTHGYYDYILAPFDKNKSILPMNINTDAWGTVFGSRDVLKQPYFNILAGALILKGIKANLPPNAPVSHIATLYNNLNASRVSDYGLRVEQIYQEQPWQ